MDCTHHWKIASPNGSTALGTCTRCGEERAFPTSSYTDVWHGISSTKPRRRLPQTDTETAAEVIRVL